MPLMRPQFGNSPWALPAISVALIAMLVAGYCFHRISYGFATLILLVLPLSVWLARNSVAQEQQGQRRSMQIVVALSLAVAAILAAIHFLHR